MIPDTLQSLVVPLDGLQPYKRNPRQGDVGAIVQSLKRHGQYRPIVVNARTQEVLAGNHTLAAARELGWTEIAATFVDVDEDQAARIVLIDNRANDLAAYDDAALADLLRDLPDLDGTGYSLDDLDELLGDLAGESRASGDTEPMEPPEEPRTRPGDLYVLGDHRLLCGDSTDLEHVVRLLDGQRIDLVFTSPPYSDLREYGGTADLNPDSLARFLPAWGQHADLLAVNLGLIQRKGEIVRYWDTYLDAAAQAGMKLLSWNVWNREEATSMAGQRMMFPIWHEWIFVFGAAPRESNRILPTKHGGKVSTRRQRQPDGSFTEPRVYPVADKKRLGSVLTNPAYRARNEDLGNHPAVFPVELPTAYIEAVTQAGQVIGEPFCGSGTTLIAAENLGRRCYAMELDPGYCDVIVDRWERHTGKTAELLPHE